MLQSLLATGWKWLFLYVFVHVGWDAFWFNVYTGICLSAYPRLAFLYSTHPAIRILENVTTGEIAGITESILEEQEYSWRKVVTQPSDS